MMSAFSAAATCRTRRALASAASRFVALLSCLVGFNIDGIAREQNRPGVREPEQDGEVAQGMSRSGQELDAGAELRVDVLDHLVRSVWLFVAPRRGWAGTIQGALSVGDHDWDG
jgi:hypothetical protein